MVLGIGKKVTIKVRFMGTEIHQLKTLIENVHEILLTIQGEVTPLIWDMVNDAIAAANSLNGFQLHTLTDEKSIFVKFQCLFITVQDFIEHSIKMKKSYLSETLRILSNYMLALMRVFNQVIARILNEEVPFIQELMRLKAATKTTSDRIHSMAA
jgi:hypothetical protein